MASHLENIEEKILNAYRGKKIAILGYRDEDNGGRDRAKWLRQHGIEVIIGLRENDKDWAQAEKDGFPVFPFQEAAEQADIVQVW